MLLLINAQKTSFSDIVLGNKYTIKSKHTNIQGCKFEVNLNKLKDNRVYRIYASSTWDEMSSYQFNKLKESVEVKYGVKLNQIKEAKFGAYSDSESVWTSNRNNISFKLRASVEFNESYQYVYSFIGIELIDKTLYGQKVKENVEF
jgi:hypothetical protein